MRPRKQAMMTTLLRLLIPAMRRFDEHYPAAVQARYRRSDCLLRVLARFVFQQPNWFRFEPRWRDRPAFLRSLQHWFQLEEILSDTTIRRRRCEGCLPWSSWGTPGMRTVRLFKRSTRII